MAESRVDFPNLGAVISADRAARQRNGAVLFIQLSDILPKSRARGSSRAALQHESFSAGAKNRGAVAGNGGTMTEVRREPRKRKKQANRNKESSGNALSRIPGPGPAAMCAEQALDEPGKEVGGKSETSDAANSKEAGSIETDSRETGETGSRTREDIDKEEEENEEGTERLQRVAADLVRLNSGDLSKVLLKKAKEGSLGSLRLLVTLAERKKPREKPVKKPRGLTLAQQLAMEPQWEEGMPEDTEEEDDPGPKPAG